MHSNDLENQRMKEICKDATRAIYRGKEDDKIDMALARALNNYPERNRIKILFLRESEGVYKFGQRRVYVKVEKGGVIFVRVGGGFLHFEDFI